MSDQSKLSKLFDKHPYELRQLQGKSNAWFKAQVASFGSAALMNPQQIMRGDQAKKSTKVLPGTMIMYGYDPKHAATLPFYDQFPLCLPFKLVKGGFYGLNLHYLPYNLRALLLDRLMQFKTTKNMTDATRLKFSWQLIDGVSRFAAAQPCVKHYLFDHVTTPFKIVESKDWSTAILLPVEQFVGASTYQVWKESTKIIRSI